MILERRRVERKESAQHRYRGATHRRAQRWMHRALLATLRGEHRAVLRDREIAEDPARLRLRVPGRAQRQ